MLTEKVGRFKCPVVQFPVELPYNEAMMIKLTASCLFCLVAALTGCAKSLPSTSDTPFMGELPIIVGRAVTVLMGPTNRWYGPEVRFLELVNRDSGQRYQVMVESEDRQFTLEVPPGEYVLSRVQISEGPFMSLADLHETFTVLPDLINYVGTWRFGVDMPKYGRKVLVSIVEEDEGRRLVAARFVEQHPEWSDRPISTALPLPVTAESRLYEVAPYPRVHRYFRRQWW